MLRPMPALLGLALIVSPAAAIADTNTAAQARTAAAVRAIDLAFEARAQAVGPAKAFREYMDGVDGLEFDPGQPIRGADAIYKAMGGDKPPTTKLEWTPTDAWGSASGDLGVTTGTWKSSSLDGSGTPDTGHYVTVWRKNGAGQWKGLIDIGSTDPAPPPPAQPAH